MKTQSYKSICSYCGVGCGVIVDKDQDGRINVKGDPDYPVNRGLLCSKGMNLHYTVMDRSDRLLYPRMRAHRKHALKRVDWNTAIERAAAVFKSLIKNHGPDSVGFYVSGQLLTEEYYLVNKLTKGFLKTANIDTNSRLCMSSAVVGYKQSLGEDSVPVSYEDIEACDTFLITGANPAWCHPILFRRVEERKSQNPNVRIVVIDPRRTQTCENADLHLALKPGTDITLYNALARGLIEKDYIDREFIRNHTESYDELKSKVFERNIEEAAEICDLHPEDIYQAVEYIGQAGTFLSLWAMGLNQSAVGVSKNRALLNLNLLTGQIGKKGSGPFSLTGQPNAMGGREVGGLSSMLAAHRDLDNPAHRREVEEYWGVENLPAKPGKSAIEMFDALRSGEMKAVWIICTNPMVSLPDSNRVKAALENAKFVIVQDVSGASDTLDFADLVLPAAGWLEKEGTMTNSERRVGHLARALDAPGEALSDTEILTRFAHTMGYGDSFTYKNMSEIYEEHAGLTRGTNLDVSGLTYHRLQTEGSLQWPVPHENHPGTARLFTDKKFYRPSGKASLFAAPDENTSEKIDDDFPLILTTGRIRDQWHTMTRTGKVQKLNRHINEPFLEMNPADAEKRKVKEGDLVNINSRRGELRVRARITDQVKPGVIFAPMHWGRIKNNDRARTNNLTSPLFDPISKEPDYKFSAAQVTRFVKPAQKIIIVGAGAAAHAFIETYRRDNQHDEIIVFSKEENPFYNRILLPDYINAKKSWPSLSLATSQELKALNVRVHAGVAAERIDREKKLLFDSRGETHEYDILVLASGSRARMLRNIPENMRGIFTLRKKSDADLIKTRSGERTIIVGGGLLGVELAGALSEIGVKVTIVQRSARLMSRQLDDKSGAILARELNEKNVDIIFNDEVIGFMGQEKVTGVYLAGGALLECDSLVCALGARPNTETAREAGLHTDHGVYVDDHLRTNDPDIYAIGEIARHNNLTYGTTLAAREQATIAARVITGDPAAYYSGTMALNILKVEGLDLVCMGKIDKTLESEEELVYLDWKHGIYKKCVVHEDRLIGAILLGDTREMSDFRDLIEKKLELGERRTSLILTDSPRVAVKGELVCSCNSVGRGNLEDLIQGGETTLAGLCQASSAGTGCGSCKPEMSRILKETILTRETATVQRQPAEISA